FKPGPPIQPSINTELCTGCKLCEVSCPNNAIRVINNKAVLDPALCVICGLCYSRCRFGAIKFS
ncbi:MAG: 4Fe-4S binding protein, partial [Ignisphaera sp.]